ncbi:T9SS type A sorting domain-containing protein [candidate division KSB1 bacterium]|nr:T9SS type A sorting domain-containing protein [candidate division KSB1 bacterium]
MRMIFIINIFMTVLFSFLSVNLLAAVTVQDDTVKVMAIAGPPNIDGIGADNCWQNCKWQSIDQVWIEYGQALDSSDFCGRYKIAWAPATNLVYFLVEIVDDVFVSGYKYDRNPSFGGGYPNYDIVEVFIDHDKSGGLHVFDGTGSTGRQWGTNAENAFSYHIAASAQPEGQVTHDKIVCDIAGRSWTDYFIANYADHFPEFALRQSAGKFLWEFSLRVYDSTYETANPAASRVVLKAGALLGLSIAYCDNDDPNEEPKQRDHFIGSVWVPKAAYNDHWMQADYFGAIQIMDASTGVGKKSAPAPINFEIYPNPGDGNLNFQINQSMVKNGVIRLFNIMGQQVLEVNPPTNQTFKLSWNHLPNGIYFLTAEMNQQIITKKITIIKN